MTRRSLTWPGILAPLDAHVHPSHRFGCIRIHRLVSVPSSLLPINLIRCLINGNKPLGPDAAEVLAAIAPKPLPGIKNLWAIRAAQVDDPVPKWTSALKMPFDRQKRSRWECVPRCKGVCDERRLETEMLKHGAYVLRIRPKVRISRGDSQRRSHQLHLPIRHACQRRNSRDTAASSFLLNYGRCNG